MWEFVGPNVLTPEVPMCGACGIKTNAYIINPKFRLKQRSFDLSYTYDGYCIASMKLKEMFARHKVSGVEFLSIGSDPTCFVLKPTAIVLFDAARRESIFEGMCQACGQYEGIYGATPAFLLQAPKTDIAGTDIMFGSGNARSPIVIATDRVKWLCKQERITAITFVVAHV
ncbi:MAG TPA: hypothetical protein VLC08_15810 [Chitinolyticbacter sp.]|nr:hypothetical protein [Chitinolyticbacter sp.]